MYKRETKNQGTHIQRGSVVNFEYIPLGSANRASSTGAKRVNGPYSVRAVSTNAACAKLANRVSEMPT